MNLGGPRNMTPLSDGESPAFNQIYDRIEETQQELPPSLRNLTFCIAYTIYKRKKREFGARLQEKENYDGKTLSRNLNNLLANNSFYDEIIREAREKMVALTDATANQVLSKLGATIVDGIDEKLNHNGRTVLQKSAHFLWESFLHAIHIVVAAIMIYAAAKFFILLGPIVGAFLDSLGFKYLGELLKAISPESST